VSFHQKRTPKPLCADNGPNSRLDQGEVYSRRAGNALGRESGLIDRPRKWRAL
jgi:hypothetical protein